MGAHDMKRQQLRLARDEHGRWASNNGGDALRAFASLLFRGQSRRLLAFSVLAASCSAGPFHPTSPKPCMLCLAYCIPTPALPPGRAGDQGPRPRRSHPWLARGLSAWLARGSRGRQCRCLFGRPCWVTPGACAGQWPSQLWGLRTEEPRCRAWHASGARAHSRPPWLARGNGV